MSDGRILSIQSHVAFGYVGGKAAVFPLQCLGFDVDVVNTVNFSNHSGYGRFGGSRANAVELHAIFHGMEENGLLSPSRLLTGYIPGAEVLSAVLDLVKRLEATHPKLIYLLDPVLGDAGQLYVAPEVVPIYRSLLPLATIITPNWFEAEVLTKVEINDMKSLKNALRILHHEYHVPHVVLSSIPLKTYLRDALPPSWDTSSNGRVAGYKDDRLLCLSSSCIRTGHERQPSSQMSTVHARCVKTIPGYFSGVGDIFSALVLAHFFPQKQLPPGTNHTPLSFAASQALTKTYAILQLTHQYAQGLPEEDRTLTDEEEDIREPDRKIRRMKGRELRIIQGQDIIRGQQDATSRDLLAWEGFWDC